MVKAELFTSHEDLEKAQIAEDMSVTPAQRPSIAFALTDLAKLSPDKKFA